MAETEGRIVSGVIDSALKAVKTASKATRKAEQQIEAFCERNPDHRRCDDVDAAAESSQSALGEGEDSAGTNSTAPGLRKAESGSSNAELESFCERKPDHRRCADYEGAEESTDSAEDGDKGEE